MKDTERGYMAGETVTDWHSSYEQHDRTVLMGDGRGNQWDAHASIRTNGGLWSYEVQVRRIHSAPAAYHKLPDTTDHDRSGCPYSKEEAMRIAEEVSAELLNLVKLEWEQILESNAHLIGMK